MDGTSGGVGKDVKSKQAAVVKHTTGSGKSWLQRRSGIAVVFSQTVLVASLKNKSKGHLGEKR